MATASRRARDVIEAAFERSVDGGKEHPLVSSRLHDFGMRGCTGVEQTVLGGTAHLLSFEGSDTMSAAYYAQVSICRQRFKDQASLFTYSQTVQMCTAGISPALARWLDTGLKCVESS